MTAAAETPPRPRRRNQNLMKSFINQILITGLLLVTLSLVEASAGPLEAAFEDNFSGLDCISIRTIRDYTALDERSLLIRSSSDKVYLVRLLQPSLELKSSIGVGFASRDSRLCPRMGDAIILDGLAPDEVRIRSIDLVTRAQANRLLVRFGLRGQPNARSRRPLQYRAPGSKSLAESFSHD